jgi:hypothetical protein
MVYLAWVVQVSNQLPCHLPTKFQQSWTPFILSILKGKDTKSKESIYHHDCQEQEEQKTPKPPTSSSPSCP